MSTQLCYHYYVLAYRLRLPCNANVLCVVQQSYSNVNLDACYFKDKFHKTDNISTGTSFY